MLNSTENRNELVIAGLCKLPKDIAYRYGYNKGECPTPSRDLHIHIHVEASTYEQLTNPAFLDRQAEKIFVWMRDNLPYGIYRRLLDKMIKHKSTYNGSTELF